MSKQHTKLVILQRESWHTKTWARQINLTEVVLISSHVQTAGRNTSDKLAVHSKRGIMNTFSLLNIEIQIRYLQNTYTILDIHLALWIKSQITYILSGNEYLRIPRKSFIYKYILRQKQITKSTKNLQQDSIKFTTSKYNMRTTVIDRDYGGCLPKYSLPQSHPTLSAGKHHSTTTF